MDIAASNYSKDAAEFSHGSMYILWDQFDISNIPEFALIKLKGIFTVFSHGYMYILWDQFDISNIPELALITLKGIFNDYAHVALK